MTATSPRLDPRLVPAIRALDDSLLPMAETWRRVCVVAEELGVPRPGYDTIRRLTVAHRRHRDELRRLLEPVAVDLARGRFAAWDVDQIIEAVIAVRADRSGSAASPLTSVRCRA